MAISLKSLRSSRDQRPPCILIYGVSGVGKTTFGAMAPKPVFIWTEEGAGLLDVQGFPRARSFQDVIDAIGVLYTEPHDFKTLVIDSLDWLEPLAWAATCAKQNPPWKSIEAPGYGRGYKEADAEWRMLFDGIEALRTDKGMAVILIAHSEIEKFEDPIAGNYDRYHVKLHKRAAALAREASDVVGFANYRVHVTQQEVGFGKQVSRGTGSGERRLFLEERPAFVAKNRFAMPASIALDWREFEPLVPALAGASAPAPAPAATTTPNPTPTPNQEPTAPRAAAAKRQEPVHV